MKYKINLETFDKYLSAIRAMEVTRFHPKMYTDMDNHRRAIHDQLFAEAGVDRKDDAFNFWLAEMVEKFLRRE